MAGVFELKSKIIDNLFVYYQIDESNAEHIDNQASDLYHRLATITNLDELAHVDDRILFALVIIIGNYIDEIESSRYRFSIIMFLIVKLRNGDVTYSFVQMISELTQTKRVDDGLKVFVYSLQSLREQFEKENIQLFDEFHDLFKSLKMNIVLLDDEIRNCGTNIQKQTILSIKTEFDRYLCDHNITISDDSDPDSQ